MAMHFKNGFHPKEFAQPHHSIEVSKTYDEISAVRLLIPKCGSQIATTLEAGKDGLGHLPILRGCLTQNSNMVASSENGFIALEQRHSHPNTKLRLAMRVCQ